MEINWSKIVTELMVALVPLLITSLISLVVAGIRLAWAGASQKYAQIAEAKPKLAAILNDAAAFGVRAAEQIGIAAKKDPELMADLTAAGLTIQQGMKRYAISAAERFLAAHNIQGIDVVLVGDAIEKAVLDEFNWISTITKNENQSE